MRRYCVQNLTNSPHPHTLTHTYRETLESEELARQLMAEEAMASYVGAADFLRHNPDQFSGEDLAALQAAMMEEDPELEEDIGEGEGEDGSAEMSYETMLQLGERIGDVKTERWAMKAEAEIKKLPTYVFQDPKDGEEEGEEKDDSEVKCLVCQCQYEGDEVLTKLPCRHVFHSECVAGWLARKDCCPYCRQCIVLDE